MKRLSLILCLLLLQATVLSAQQPDPAQIKTLLDQLTTTVQTLKTLLTPPIVPASTGVTVKVAAGGNLQAAIDAAVPGTTILVAPGTFTGNVILRKKATAGIITVRTDGLDDAKLPPKVRVNGPALSAQLAKLKPRDPLVPVITSEPGAHDYVLIGLEAFGVA